jgi:hypothetical protein
VPYRRGRKKEALGRYSDPLVEDAETYLGRYVALQPGRLRRHGPGKFVPDDYRSASGA